MDLIEFGSRGEQLAHDAADGTPFSEAATELQHLRQEVDEKGCQEGVNCEVEDQQGDQEPWRETHHTTVWTRIDVCGEDKGHCGDGTEAEEDEEDSAPPEDVSCSTVRGSSDGMCSFDLKRDEMLDREV